MEEDGEFISDYVRQPLQECITHNFLATFLCPCLLFVVQVTLEEHLQYYERFSL